MGLVLRRGDPWLLGKSSGRRQPVELAVLSSELVPGL